MLVVAAEDNGDDDEDNAIEEWVSDDKRRIMRQVMPLSSWCILKVKVETS